MKYGLRMKRKGPEFDYYGIKKAKPNKDDESVNMEKNHRRPLSNFEFIRQKTEKGSKLQGIKNPPVKATYLKKSKASNLYDKSNSLVVDVEPVDVGSVDVATVYVEPVDKENVNLEPVNVEAVNVEAVNVEVVNVEAVNVEAVNVEAVNVEAVNVEPVNVEHVKDYSKCTCSSLLGPWMLRMEQKQDVMMQKFDELISIRNKEVNANSSVSPGEAGQNCIEKLNTEENGASYDQFEISFMGDSNIVSQDSVETNSDVEAMASTKENVANYDQIEEHTVGLVEKNGLDSIQAFDSGHVCHDGVEKNSEAMANTPENITNDQAEEDGACFMEKSSSNSIQAFDSIGIINEMINSIALKFPYREINHPKVFNDQLNESTVLFTKMATYLSGVGGTEPKATLHIFNKIFSKELQQEFNWDDKGTTIKSFPNILSLIHAAGRLSHAKAYNEKNTNEMIKNSLRNARSKKKN